MPDNIRNDIVDKSQDTRGPIEKVADAVTNDRVDDKTGKVIRDEGPQGAHEDLEDGEAYNPDDVARRNDWIDPDTDLDPRPFHAEQNPRSNVSAEDGRDALERAADALTGDDIDDPAPRTHVQ